MAQIEKGPIPLTVQEDAVDEELCTDLINFEGDVAVVPDGLGGVTVTIGETGTAVGKQQDFIFVANGNTADKWLGFGNGSTTSDDIPLILPYGADLVAITFSNNDDDVDIDLEIYENGTAPGNLVFTWEIRNKRTAWITDMNGLNFAQGDRISVFMRKYIGGSGDPTAQDPIIEVFFASTDDVIGEGGTQYGI